MKDIQKGKMQMKMTKPSRILSIFAAILAAGFTLSPAPAWADCSSSGDLPAAAAGALGFETADNAYYYCDGTDWLKILDAGQTGSNLGHWTLNAATGDVYNTASQIGIGTDTPDALLHVQDGDIRIENDQLLRWAGGGSYIQGSSGADYLKFKVGDNGHFEFVTAGDESMRITSDGNVGIGTNEPSAKAHIVNTGSDDSFVVFDQASDTTPFVITNDGKVGIRNGAPEHVFHVHVSNPGDNLAVVNGADIGTYLTTALSAAGSFRMGLGNNLHFDGTNWITGTDGSSNGASGVFGKYGPGELQFFVVPSTGTTRQTISNADLGSLYMRMVIKSDGDVGIGDSTPDSGEQNLKLDVTGAIGGTHYCDTNGNNCVSASDLGSGNAGHWTLNASTGDVYNTASQIGIGTNNPSNALTVSLSNNDALTTTSKILDMDVAGLGLLLRNTSNNVDSILSGIKFDAFDGEAAIAATYDSTNRASLVFGTEAGAFDNNAGIEERMRITANGNVGLGFNDPSQGKLDVKGDIYTSGTVIAAGNIGFSYNNDYPRITYWGADNNYPSILFDTGSGTDGFRYRQDTDEFQFLIGGTAITRVNASDFNISTLDMSVNAISAASNIGATGYCDENGANCFDPVDVAAGNVGHWTLNTSNGAVYNTTSSIGIGTNAPTGQLDIKAASGNAVFELDAAEGSNARMYFSDGGSIIWNLGHAGSNGSFTFFDTQNASTPITIESGASTTNALRIASNGNVGIGTSNPLERFQVGTGYAIRDGGAGSIIHYYNLEWDETDSRREFMGHIGAGKYGAEQSLNVNTGEWSFGITSNTGDTGDAATVSNIFNLYTGGDARFGGSSNTLYVDASENNVGIGTNSPSATLSVAGDAQIGFNNSDYRSLIIKHNATSGGALMFEREGFSPFIGYSGFQGDDGVRRLLIGGSSWGEQDANEIRFYTDATDGAGNDEGVERMRIDGDGNVGIGTDEPASKLHVNIGSDTSGIRIETTAASSDVLEIRVNGVERGGLRKNSTGDPEIYAFGAGNDLHVTSDRNILINPDGNVGIGTNEPSSTLHVIGTIKADELSFNSVTGEATSLWDNDTDYITPFRFGGAYVRYRQSEGQTYYENYTPNWSSQWRLSRGSSDGFQRIMQVSASDSSQSIQLFNNTTSDIDILLNASGDSYIREDGLIIGDTTISTGEQALTLDVAGAIGGTHYCDEDGNNCITAADLASGDAGHWTLNATTGDVYNTTSNIGIGRSLASAKLDVNISDNETIRLHSMRIVDFVGESANGWVRGAWQNQANEDSEKYVYWDADNDLWKLDSTTTNDDVGGFFFTNNNAIHFFNVEGDTSPQSWSNGDFVAENVHLTINQNNTSGSQLAGGIGIKDAYPDARLEISLDGLTTADAFYVSSNDGDDGDLFTIDGNGNVGIGTNAPSYKLHVISANRQIMIEDSDDPNGSWAIGTGNDNRDLSFMDDGGLGAVRMIIEEGGDVGIGTETPNNNGEQPLKLDVAGAIGGTHYCDEDGNNCITAADLASGDAGHWTLNASTGAVYNTTSNVGIGTNAPSENLHLLGEDTDVIFEGSVSSEVSIKGPVAILSLQDTSDSDDTLIRFKNNTNGLVYSMGPNSSASDDNFRFISNAEDFTFIGGNVGVGTNAPSGRMHIWNGDSGQYSPNLNADELVIENSTAAGINILSGNTSEGSIRFGDRDMPNAGGIIYNHSGDQMVFRAGNNTARMSILSSGSVGIGFNTPSQGLLDVNGDIYSSSDIWATDYCDENGANCFDPVTISSGDLGHWTLNSSNGAVYNTTSNIGIGTDTPTAKLDIQDGNIAMVIGADNTASTRTNATAKYARLALPHYTNAEEPVALIMGESQGSTSTVNIGGGSSLMNAATSIVFRTAGTNTTPTGTERMRVDSSGNVGIGETVPEGRLHIKTGNSGATGYSFADDLIIEASSAAGINILTPDNNAGSIDWSNPSDSRAASIQWNYDAGLFDISTRTDGASIKISSGNYVEAMTIDPSGNVGIGTNEPSEELHVMGDVKIEDINDTALLSMIGVNSSQISMTSSSNTTYKATLQMRYAEESFRLLGGSDYELISADGYNFPNNLKFHTSNVERMRIDGSGNLGIGTNEPSEKLHVAEGNIKLSQGDATNYWVGANSFNRYHPFDNGARSGMVSASDFYIQLDSNNDQTNSAFVINKDNSNLAGGTELFRIQENGNVGVGTNDPDEKLHVSGDIKATNFISTSDIALKKNIEPLNDNILSKIMSLTGVKFDWKDEDMAADSGAQIGFIAQDVEKVFPELVSGDDGNKAVNYGGMTAPLIEAVKALKMENDNLRAQNDELKSRMDAIESRLQALEQ